MSKNTLKPHEATHLIPIHINLARDNHYYYGWSSGAKCWVRKGEIPSHMKKAYSNPVVKSNYK